LQSTQEVYNNRVAIMYLIPKSLPEKQSQKSH